MQILPNLFRIYVGNIFHCIQVKYSKLLSPHKFGIFPVNRIHIIKVSSLETTLPPRQHSEMNICDVTSAAAVAVSLVNAAATAAAAICGVKQQRFVVPVAHGSLSKTDSGLIRSCLD